MPEPDSETLARFVLLLLLLLQFQLLVDSVRRRRTSKAAPKKKKEKQKNQVLKRDLRGYFQKVRLILWDFVSHVHACAQRWALVCSGWIPAPPWACVGGSGVLNPWANTLHGPTFILSSSYWSWCVWSGWNFTKVLNEHNSLPKKKNPDQLVIDDWVPFPSVLCFCMKYIISQYLWHSCTGFKIPTHPSFHLVPSTYLVPGHGCRGRSILSFTSSSTGSRNKRRYSRTTAPISSILYIPGIKHTQCLGYHILLFFHHI